ncbi:MAG TPA: SulP family inorganic anion transporter [Oligoflexia bacterium]|nr:SulP family inorganic anion transporter [Oligoflexia bacterium]HMR24618.1 SulP family inorganic anion transporter [Oligoflexia bacterium]
MLDVLKQYRSEDFKQDFSASVVVFLVATPLCLGIALASGAPLFSGIVAGIVGGIIVGSLSGSQLGVSGPAAGLAVIVLNAIGALGWETFLLSVVIAGFMQIGLGYLQAGVIGYYFPSAVIKGMLAGIGLIIILKQIPHAVGYDAVPEGLLEFKQADSFNTFSELGNMFSYVQPAAILITLISLAILIAWEQPRVKKMSLSKWVQGPLLVVIFGIIANQVLLALGSSWALDQKHVVQIPVSSGFSEFMQLFTLPDFSKISQLSVYTTALTLAVVASLETLLCVEATDKLDPYKRVTPTNRELKAQGVGNVVSGLIGGLPITQVIVRSSANIQSGGKTQMSAIFHGFLLLLISFLLPNILNMIPLASLAAILLLVGYKLAHPKTFKAIFKLGRYQFLPFIVTVVAILLTDLLTGIGLGLVVAVFFILLNNFRHSYACKTVVENGQQEHMKLYLSENVSFWNRASIIKILQDVKPNSKLTIDAKYSINIDHDIYEIIDDFKKNAQLKNVEISFKGELFNKLHNKEVTP